MFRGTAHLVVNLIAGRIIGGKTWIAEVLPNKDGMRAAFWCESPLLSQFITNELGQFPALGGIGRNDDRAILLRGVCKRDCGESMFCTGVFVDTSLVPATS